jgi:hypothetical protein
VDEVGGAVNVAREVQKRVAAAEEKARSTRIAKQNKVHSTLQGTALHSTTNAKSKADLLEEVPTLAYRRTPERVAGAAEGLSRRLSQSVAGVCCRLSNWVPKASRLVTLHLVLPSSTSHLPCR